jgi:hypothetical protein
MILLTIRRHAPWIYNEQSFLGERLTEPFLWCSHPAHNDPTLCMERLVQQHIYFAKENGERKPDIWAYHCFESFDVPDSADRPYIGEVYWRDQDGLVHASFSH